MQICRKIYSRSSLLYNTGMHKIKVIINPIIIICKIIVLKLSRFHNHSIILKFLLKFKIEFIRE